MEVATPEVRKHEERLLRQQVCKGPTNNACSRLCTRHLSLIPVTHSDRDAAAPMEHLKKSISATTLAKLSQADLDLGQPNFKLHPLPTKSHGSHLVTTTKKCLRNLKERAYGLIVKSVPPDPHHRLTCLKHLVPSQWCHVGGLGNLEEVKPRWKKCVIGGVGLEVFQSGLTSCLSPTCSQQTLFDKHLSPL